MTALPVVAQTYPLSGTGTGTDNGATVDLRAQVQSILAMVQQLPSVTNEQLTQKIQLLQQALQLQLQVRGGGQVAAGQASIPPYDPYAYNNAASNPVYQQGGTNYSNQSAYMSAFNPTSNPSSYGGGYTPAVPSLSLQTAGADQLTPTSARLTGIISRSGGSSGLIKVWFEWGTDAGLGLLGGTRLTAQTNVSLQSGTVGSSAVVSNLSPDTTYYYRVIIMPYDQSYAQQLAQAPIKGEIKIFRTPPQPPVRFF